MIHATLLIAHFVAAGITGVVGIGAGVILWRQSAAWYKVCILVLALLAFFETATGIWLMALSGFSLSGCVNIFVYLSIVAVLEVLLGARLRRATVTKTQAQAPQPTAQ